MSKQIQNKIVLFSLVIGLVHSLLASLFFEIIILIEKMLREGSFSILDYQKFSHFRLTNIISLSIFPFLIISLIFVMFFIVKKTNEGEINVKKFSFYGWLLGLGAGLVMCIFAYILVLHNSSLDRFLFLISIGLVVSSFTGMAIGYQISNFVFRESKI